MLGRTRNSEQTRIPDSLSKNLNTHIFVDYEKRGNQNTPDNISKGQAISIRT